MINIKLIIIQVLCIIVGSVLIGLECGFRVGVSVALIALAVAPKDITFRYRS